MGHRIQSVALCFSLRYCGSRNFARLWYFSTTRSLPVAVLGNRRHETRFPIFSSSKTTGGLVQRCTDEDIHSTTQPPSISDDPVWPKARELIPDPNPALSDLVGCFRQPINVLISVIEPTFEFRHRVWVLLQEWILLSNWSVEPDFYCNALLPIRFLLH